MRRNVNDQISVFYQLAEAMLLNYKNNLRSVELSEIVTLNTVIIANLTVYSSKILFYFFG